MLLRSLSTHLLLTLVLTLGLAGNINAAENYPPVIPQAEVEGLVTMAQTLITADRQPNSNATAYAVQMFSKDCRSESLNQLQQQVLLSKSDYVLADWGIKMEAAYRLALGDVKSNRQTSYVGLALDVLYGGLLENRSKAQRLRDEQKLLALRYPHEKDKEAYGCRDAALRNYFNRLKLEVLKTKEALLQRYADATRKRYLLVDILYDDWLKIQSELEQTSHAKAVALQHFKILGDREVLHIPQLLDLNLQRMVETLQQERGSIDALRLKERILGEKYDSLYDTTLKFYARSGFRENDGQYEPTSNVGVVMSMPIPLPRESALQAELALASAQRLSQRDDLLLEAERLHAAYHEKFHDAISMKYRYQVAGERLRRALIKFDTYYTIDTYFDVIQQVIEFIDVELEYTSVLEGLYRRLLHVFSASEAGYQAAWLSPVDMESEQGRARVGERTVYMQASVFNNYDNAFLFNLFVAKQIGRVVLSADKRLKQDKVLRFMNAAATQGIGVEWRLPTHHADWFDPKQWDALQHHIQHLQASGANIIHLDIQAQPKPTSETDQVLSQQYVLTTIEKIHSQYPRLKIAISLPVITDKALLVRLFAITDRIYVQVDGLASAAFVEQHLHDYLELNSQNLVITVQLTDFTDELRLEQFFDQLYARLQLKQFALDNVSGLLEIAGQ